MKADVVEDVSGRAGQLLGRRLLCDAGHGAAEGCLGRYDLASEEAVPAGWVVVEDPWGRKNASGDVISLHLCPVCAAAGEKAEPYNQRRAL